MTILSVFFGGSQGNIGKSYDYDLCMIVKDDIFDEYKKNLLEAIFKILKSGDLEAHQELIKAVEKTFRQSGYGKVFDEWEGKEKWAINFRSDFKVDKI